MLKKILFLISCILLFLSFVCVVKYNYTIFVSETYFNNYKFSFEVEKKDSLIYYGHRVNNSKRELSKNITKTLFRRFCYLNSGVFSYIESVDNDKGVLRNNKGFVYSIIKNSNDEYIFNAYNNGSVIDTYGVKKIPSKFKIFMMLRKGLNSNVINDIDSTTCNDIKSTGQFSTHRFRDGTILVIEYVFKNGNYNVKNWFYNKDKLQLYRRILKKDYNLIE